MATCRVFGSASVTSRPPISTRPAVGVSSPATHFNVVVLPAPLGPSRTKNSPSPTSRSSPSRATSFPYSLRIARNVRVAILNHQPPRRLPLHRPECQTTNQEPLDREREQQGRDQGNQRRCSGQVVARGGTAQEGERSNRHCLRIAPGQGKWE